MFLKKLKIKLTYDAAIRLLGIYLKEMQLLSQKNICTPMFIATLFTIAKIWKQSKCPSMNEWIKKMWYIYKTEYYSAIKKWKNAICSNMDGPRDYHTKWSKPDRERQISYAITYMWNLKIWYKWIYLQNRNRPTDIEKKLMVTKGERGRGIN